MLMRFHTFQEQFDPAYLNPHKASSSLVHLQ